MILLGSIGIVTILVAVVLVLVLRERNDRAEGTFYVWYSNVLNNGRCRVTVGKTELQIGKFFPPRFQGNIVVKYAEITDLNLVPESFMSRLTVVHSEGLINFYGKNAASILGQLEASVKLSKRS